MDSIKRFGGVLILLSFPILLLIQGVSNIRSWSGRVCLILFISFFGYQLIYNVAGTEFGSGADCARYAVVFSWASNLSDISFTEFFSQLDSHDNVDYFNPLLLYFVSRITSNIHVYFMVYAFIFALFYINNIYIVLSQCDRNLGRTWKLLFCVCCFIMSVHDFGGIRMPLAFQVFLFGVLRYIFLNNKFSLLWVLASLLVHYSMFVFVIAFFAFLSISKGRVSFFFAFFIFGHLLGSIDIPFVKNLFMLLPGGVEDRLNLYTHEANIEQFKSGGKFYLGTMNLWGMLDSMILRYYILIVMGWLYIKRVKLNNDHKYLYKLSLFMYGCAMLLSNMPSGYRFILPSSFICFATVSIIYANDDVRNTLSTFHKWYTPMLVLFLLHRFRFILDEVGLSVIYTNFITMFFVDDNVPILDTIKSIF